MGDVVYRPVRIQSVLDHHIWLFEGLERIPIFVVLLHAELDLSYWVEIVSSRVFLLEILIDQRSGSQHEDCRLGPDETLNKDGAVDELKEDESYVEQATDALVREKVIHSQGKHTQRNREEDRIELEGN